MARSDLGEYGGAYIHVTATITVPHIAAVDAAKNNTNKKVILKIVLNLLLAEPK